MPADIALVKRNIGAMIDQGAPDAAIDAYLEREGVSFGQLRAPTREAGSAPGYIDTAEDMAKSFGSGVVRGGASMLGIGGDLAKLGDPALRALEAGGVPVAQNKRAMLQAMPAWLRKYHENPETPIGSAEIMGAVDRATGLPVTSYKPETTAGKYARTAGEFAPNALMPGSMPQRVLAGVVAPAIASEAAGQATEGTSKEGWARLAAALGGGVAAGSALAVANRRGGIPGMAPASSRALEKTVTPGAEARMAELGPDAFLFEGSPAAFGVAKGIAIEPGDGMSRLVDAVTTRHRQSNARLNRDVDQAVGPAVSPQRLEGHLEDQRAGLQPLYQQVSGLNEPVQLQHVYDQLRVTIPQEAGATQQALRRVMDMIAPANEQTRQRIVRSQPREVLNVRQALDDEIGRLGDAPKAQRAVTEYRRLIDEALGEAVPDLKVLDQTYANLMRGSEALKRGSQIFDTGKTAIRPEDLIAERAALSLPQREAMRHGTRAEIDRVMGTKANDALALKLALHGEGDWNRVKLAEIFGGREADRILRAVDREAAFQSAYNKLIENSQTAQRLAGRDLVKTERVAAPSVRDLTVLGAVVSPMQRGYQRLREAVAGGRQATANTELADALTTQGPARDALLAEIRKLQTSRSKGTVKLQNELARLLAAGNAATVDARAER